MATRRERTSIFTGSLAGLVEEEGAISTAPDARMATRRERTSIFTDFVAGLEEEEKG